MLILAIVLAVLLVCFILAYAFQLHQAKGLTKQLQKMNDEHRKQIVTMSFPTEANQNLLGEINRLILETQKTEQNCQAMEKRLQELVSNVSHDLRTPLTAILGYIGLINSGDLSEADTKKYLRIIEQRAKTLQNLILSLYDVSRLDEGKYQFHLEQTDVGQVCLEVLAELYDEFEKDGITIEAAIDDHIPNIYIDRNELKRVYENLLQNARKHGSGSIYITDRTEQNTLVLSISNSSPHIGENEIVKIFERSYSIDEGGGNTGLGLSISKLLLEKMGHRIQAFYRDGKFTVQIIFIPKGDACNE